MGFRDQPNEPELGCSCGVPATACDDPTSSSPKVTLESSGGGGEDSREKAAPGESIKGALDLVWLSIE